MESGRLIADCKIIQPLAENQTYQTWLAEAPQYGLVWLYLFNAALFPDEKARQKFLADAKKISAQTFSGVCTALHADSSETGSYILYPVPSGQPLTAVFAAECPPRQALELVLQAAHCLEPVHRAGLWHGNLSLNSLFSEEDRLVIAAFALSQLVRLDFNAGVDPGYSSPELVRGEPLSPAADLYSLGIILFRLLTGRLPFTGEQPFAIAMQHLQGEIPQLPESLLFCQPLLDGLLAAVAAERISTAELIEQLQHLLASSELDELAEPLQLSLAEVVPDSSSVELVADLTTYPVTANHEGKMSPIEQLISEADVAARMEKRLTERAAALQRSVPQLDSKRLPGISQQEGQTEMMNSQKTCQKKSPRSRLLQLTLLGIAIGGVLYLLLFQLRPAAQQSATRDVPAALTAALEEGGLQLQNDNPAAAEKIFVALIDQFPGYPQPYNNLAVVHARQGQLEAARSALEQALATDVDYATVYRNLGTIYAEMARDSYGRALQLKKGQQTVNLLMFAAEGPRPLSLAQLAGEPPSVPAPVAEPVTEPVTEPVAAPEILDATAVAIDPVIVPPVAAGVDAPEVQEEIATVIMTPEPESAELFLHRWAAAWSAQEVETYLSFYAESYVPANGQSREQWAASRKARLSKPTSIAVSLEDFAPLRIKTDKVQVEVTQAYRSDRFADRTRKVFDLQRKGDTWQILRERSLGRVR